MAENQGLDLRLKPRWVRDPWLLLLLLLLLLDPRSRGARERPCTSGEERKRGTSGVHSFFVSSFETPTLPQWVAFLGGVPPAPVASLPVPAAFTFSHPHDLEDLEGAHYHK